MSKHIVTISVTLDGPIGSTSSDIERGATWYLRQVEQVSTYIVPGSARVVSVQPAPLFGQSVTPVPTPAAQSTVVGPIRRRWSLARFAGGKH